jgi:hypothetical protein
MDGEQIEVSYKRLSSGSADVAMDAAEYAYPKTVAGCWKTLDSWLASDRITKSTYDEIKSNVTFELVVD